MSDKQSKIWGALNFIGGMGGLLAILTIVFYGGNLVQQVRSLESRVTKIETGGSGTAREHITADAVVTIDHERRITVLETMLPTMDRKLDRLLER